MSTVDLVTGEAMVVLQDRPVAALSPWLAEAVAECSGTSRALQLRRPPRCLKCLLSKLTKEELSSSTKKATSAFAIKRPVPAFHCWLLRAVA